MVTKKTSAFALTVLICALASTLLLPVQASAEQIGKIAKEAGTSMAIDAKTVYWIAGGKLMKGSVGAKEGSELGYKSVQRVSAGGTFFAFSTLTTKVRSGGKQVFTRKLYRSIDGGGTRRLATTTEEYRSQLYCGGDIGLWGISTNGTLLYHTTTNKKRNKCSKKYTTSFFTVGGSKESAKIPEHKTSEYVLGAQGTRVATKVPTRKGKFEARTIDFSKSSKSLLGPFSFEPISASFDTDGNTVVTTEGGRKGKENRSAFVGNKPFEPQKAQWRYRACGHSVVRWLDEAISGGKKVAIEVVKNPLDTQSEEPREILSKRSGSSIRALSCDHQRIAYVLASSAKTTASATVQVDKIDSTKPVVSISAPGTGTNTIAASVRVDVTVTEVVSRAETRCTLSNNGGVGQDFKSGDNVALTEGANSLVVSCTDAVDNTGDSTPVVVNRGTAPDMTITAPANNSNMTANTTAVTWATAGTAPISCTVNGNAATSPAIVNLANGANTITATCSNAFGSDTETVVVNRGTAPGAVEITFPGATSSTSNPTTTVEFTVGGASIVPAGITCTITNTTNDEEDIQNAGSAASGSISLDFGANIIETSCTNAYGTTTSGSITITRDP